jgi:TPR repeat protein
MYRNGEGVPRNHKEALRWLRKAAKHRHACTQNTFGCMYRDGEGVTQKTEIDIGGFIRQQSKVMMRRKQFSMPALSRPRSNS